MTATIDFAPTTPELSRARFADIAVRYELAITEVRSKVEVLNDRLDDPQRGRPIDVVASRVKSFDRIVNKAERIGCPLEADAVRAAIRDIAGVRIVCCTLSEVYRVAQQLGGLDGMVVTAVEDYIASPKPNGYRSLHLMAEVTVPVAGRFERVPVEIQIRTRAMDVWAGFEHAFVYRDRRPVPHGLARELTHAAELAHRLDMTLERLRNDLAGTGAARVVAP
jgi:putative GTP pyrophosphokinase